MISEIPTKEVCPCCGIRGFQTLAEVSSKENKGFNRVVVCARCGHKHRQCELLRYTPEERENLYEIKREKRIDYGRNYRKTQKYEDGKARRRERYHSDKEYSDRKKAIDKKYRDKNREEIRRKNLAWYYRNREHVLAKAKIYYRKHRLEEKQRSLFVSRLKKKGMTEEQIKQLLSISKQDW